jgi:hypothetical protein
MLPESDLEFHAFSPSVADHCQDAPGTLAVEEQIHIERTALLGVSSLRRIEFLEILCGQSASAF